MALGWVGILDLETCRHGCGGTEGARCDLRGSGVSDVVLCGDVGKHRHDNAGDFADRSRGTADVSKLRRTSRSEAGVQAGDQVSALVGPSHRGQPFTWFSLKKNRGSSPEPVGAACNGLRARVCPSPPATGWGLGLHQGDEGAAACSAALKNTFQCQKDASDGSVAGPMVVLPQSQIRDYFYCSYF